MSVIIWKYVKGFAILYVDLWFLIYYFPKRSKFGPGRFSCFFLSFQVFSKHCKALLKLRTVDSDCLQVHKVWRIFELVLSFRIKMHLKLGLTCDVVKWTRLKSFIGSYPLGKLFFQNWNFLPLPPSSSLGYLNLG